MKPTTIYDEMISMPRGESGLPSRVQGIVFDLKAAVFRGRRMLSEWGDRPPRHQTGGGLEGAEVFGEAKAALWSQVGAEEFPLTAGKVENLRIAARSLHGLEIPAGQIFSFWRQLGRPTRFRGYTTGRELREGCLIPNIGGGLCQITGLLYQAATKAGLDIVERHAHSRLIPGSMGEQNLDATVFWNYVDLRFRADFAWRLEVELDATDLYVRIKADRGRIEHQAPEVEQISRESPTGDCLTCGQVACFRHPSATAHHAPALGHSSFLLDAHGPEFDEWCTGHSREGDHWFVPLDGTRWRKPNYVWSPPPGSPVFHATGLVLWRSFWQRWLPAQGAVRQTALELGDAKLAKSFAARISRQCRHLVVSQNLLPHLWKLGVLGGRTFDVLVTRWPLAELSKRLNEAASRHPESSTLGDFRPDSEWVRAENAALDMAGKLITPHRAIAAHFGHRAWLLDWKVPEVKKRMGGVVAGRYLLPCSPLGRKGIYELQAAYKNKTFELIVLGRAREEGIKEFYRVGDLADLETAEALVLPAWIEHQPRLALRALAMGIPVIASKDCGLAPHPLLRELEDPKEITLS